MSEREAKWYIERRAKTTYPNARDPRPFGYAGARERWDRLGLSPDLAPPPPKAKKKLLTTRPVVPEIPHPTVLSFGAMFISPW